MSCCSGRKPRLANRFREASELINKETNVQKQAETSFRHSKILTVQKSQQRRRRCTLRAQRKRWRSRSSRWNCGTILDKLNTQVAIICEAGHHWQPWHTYDSHACELRGRDHGCVFQEGLYKKYKMGVVERYTDSGSFL